ncbi:MAG: dephospho-CoA kinase [Solirubrobacteraceae bacterium]
MPPFVALTGAIGAGKSTALAALERLGAATLSTDAVVHELYSEPEVREAVRARFGEQVAADGAVDRRRLARAAFATAEDRDWLERLIWPRVRERVAGWRECAQSARPRPRALVVEVPLLFESGQDALYDATIVVSAPERLRRARAADRGHEALAQRGERQLSQAEKAARATYVVENGGDLLALEHKLSSVLAILGV